MEEEVVVVVLHDDLMMMGWACICRIGQFLSIDRKYISNCMNKGLGCHSCFHEIFALVSLVLLSPLERLSLESLYGRLAYSTSLASLVYCVSLLRYTVVASVGIPGRSLPA